MTAENLLEVSGLRVVYGSARAVSGVSLTVDTGEAVALLGANGAGKSSLARAVCGLVPPADGEVRLEGNDITGRSATAISRLGVAYLPEGRGIFPGLSVLDNLRVMVRGAGQREALEQAYELFPQLAERRKQTARTLSGGEQQMLALARVIVTRPRLLIADEPSLGLAPKIIEQIFESLHTARAAGTSILLIEQYVHRALAFCDSAIILRRGSVVWRGASDELGADAMSHYIGGEEVLASVQA